LFAMITAVAGTFSLQRILYDETKFDAIVRIQRTLALHKFFFRNDEIGKFCKGKIKLRNLKNKDEMFE